MDLECPTNSTLTIYDSLFSDIAFGFGMSIQDRQWTVKSMEPGITGIFIGVYARRDMFDIVQHSSLTLAAEVSEKLQISEDQIQITLSVI